MAACGARDEAQSHDAADGSDDLRIRPTLGSGDLAITVPSGMTLAYTVEVMRTGGAWQSAVVGVNTLPVGSYCVRTTDNSARASSDAACGYEVKARVRTDLALGAVEFTRSRGELVYGIDLEQRSGVNTLLALHGRFPHPVGTFEYVSIAGIDSVSFTVTGGTTATVDLNDTTGRAALRLVPESATLPLYEYEGGMGVQFGFDSYSQSRTALRSPVLLRGRAGQRVILNGSWFGTSVVNAPTALAGGAITDVRIAALEVDDVAYAQAGGNVNIAGTFDVKLGTANVLTNVPTGHAVHLLLASYRVVVKYRVPGASIDSFDEYAADLR